MKTLRELMAQYFRKGEEGRHTVTGWDFREDKALPRPKAIRAKCFDCQAGQQSEVRNCEMTDCPLWPWRMGSLKRSLEAIPDDNAARNEGLDDELDSSEGEIPLEKDNSVMTPMDNTTDLF